MFTYCAPTRDAAKEAVDWLDRANVDVMNAYGLNDPSNFQGVKGYETYAARLGNATSAVSPEELRRRLTGNDDAGEKKAMPAYDQSNFLIGTPDQLIERIGDAQKPPPSRRSRSSHRSATCLMTRHARAWSSLRRRSCRRSTNRRGSP